MARFSWGGGASGAASGAAAGSAFGPWGTGIGAAIGGLTGGFGGGGGSSRRSSRNDPTKPIKLSTFDKKQKKLYDEQMKALRGRGPFKDLYKFNKKSGFYNFDTNAANQNFNLGVAQPAYQSFEENIIPGITGQFRQQNLQNSSYAGEALGKAGRDVQQNLDAMRGNMIYQGIQQADQRKYNDFNAINDRRQGTINTLLGNPTFGYREQGTPPPSMLDSILGKAAPLVGDFFSNFLRGNGTRNKPPQAQASAQNAPPLFSTMNQMGSR